MKTRHKRMALIGAGLAVLAIAAALVLNAFQSNLVFFFSPSQVAAKEAPLEKAFRIGGMVETGSIKRQQDAGKPLPKSWVRLPRGHREQTDPRREGEDGAAAAD